MSKQNKDTIDRGAARSRERPTAPWPDTAEAVRRTMRANRGKDTKPELALRSLLHLDGYRFRIHGRGLPGTPDVVFTARRKAVFAHGCFWHSHPGCRNATVPKTRSGYWVPKLARNRERDTEHTVKLRAMGWYSLVVWECEMMDGAAVQERLRDFLGPVRHRPGPQT